MRIALALTALLLVLVGCSGTGETSSDWPASDTTPGDEIDGFIAALQNGADCATLIERKNALDPNLHERANQELRKVGCTSVNSEREPSGENDEAPGPWKDIPGKRVQPSPGCMSAMVTAATEKDPSRADPLITATLNACKSLDEWMSALEIEPGVMGMVEGTTPDLLSLQIVCRKAKESAVCADAIERGVEIP